MTENTRPETPRLPGFFKSRGWPGLSGKLLMLTILFVMIAEVLIFVPSVANFRNNWLEARVNSARIAALAVEAAPQDMLPPDLERALLENTGVEAISIKKAETRRLLAVAPPEGELRHTIDLRETSVLSSISQTLGLFFMPGEGLIRAMDDGGAAGDTLEIVVREEPLRHDMLGFARNILILSLIISLFTAGLVYLALVLMFVRPVRRLTLGMISFAESPEEKKRILPVSARRDEIGMAERELAAMQKELQGLLRQKNNLANLGLAVSKISHDLRNMIAGAHLVADRMSMVKDPVVQRFAPRLIASLDRALDLCETTLKYGKASEREPLRERMALHGLISEVFESLGLPEETDIALQNQVGRDLEIDADREQLFRVLLNLCRNAAQALADHAGERCVSVLARREGAVVTIEVRDTGPGVPVAVREKLFKPFQNNRRDGIGLGLTIAYELVRAHGGDIRLAEGTLGAAFLVILPDAVVKMAERRPHVA